MARINLTVDSECKTCKGTGSYLRQYYVPVEHLRTGKNYIPSHRVLCSCVIPETQQKKSDTQKCSDCGRSGDRNDDGSCLTKDCSGYLL